jgi:hypothetical protein
VRWAWDRHADSESAGPGSERKDSRRKRVLSAQRSHASRVAGDTSKRIQGCDDGGGSLTKRYALRLPLSGKHRHQ